MEKRKLWEKGEITEVNYYVSHYAFRKEIKLFTGNG